MVFFTSRSIPDCCPTYYVSEAVPMSDSHGRCLLTGTGSFTQRLLTALEMIERSHRYVLYLQEDMWITQPIAESTLSALVQVMERNDLDCLKLGWLSFHPDDRATILEETDVMSDTGPFDLRWFGGHPYSLSHHCSIFKTSFLADTARWGLAFRATRPIQHEVMLSSFLAPRISATDDDGKELRIAVWNDQPIVEYVHASAIGRLTHEGADLLRHYGRADDYDESLVDEVFPHDR